MQRTRHRIPLGFVGLGGMGAPLAGRLLYRNRVYGTDRAKAKANGLIAEGLIWRDTPREVAAAAEVVFSLVSDDAALAAVASGPDGILAGLRPGALYIDLSAVSPHARRELAEQVRAVGATMIDARVRGGLAAAESGTLAITVDGTEAAYHAAEPLLLRLATTVTHLGGNGDGRAHSAAAADMAPGRSEDIQSRHIGDGGTGDRDQRDVAQLDRAKA